MTVSVSGIARTVLVSAAAAALVAGATQAEGGFALGDASTGAARQAGASAPVRGATLLCPGPELKGVPGLDDEPVGAAVAAATAPERLLGDAAPEDTSGKVSLRGMPGRELGSPLERRGATGSATVGSASGVQVQGSEALAPGLAAAQSWLVRSGDRRGLVSAPCREAAAESWILAGGGQPGRQERLVLTNPGGNAVTVDVTLHGPDGPLSSPAGRGIVVAAHGRSSFLLDSISSEVKAPAVHVVAQGGVVGAVVNDVWLDGTRAAGVDDAVPTAPPSREQVVPAVSIGGQSTLRVAVPGSDEAVVQVRVLTENGPRAVPSGAVTRIGGGAVRDIDLSRLPQGSVGLQVRADRPVVAAAVVTRQRPQQPGDLAWSSSTTPITGVAGVPFGPPAGSPDARVFRRVVVAVTREKASVEVVTVDKAGDSSFKRITVGPDSSAGVDVTDAASVWVHRVSGAGQVRAGVISWVTQADGSLITTTPLTDAPLRTSAVGVRPAPLP
jgi:hypothetical protein